MKKIEMVEAFKTALKNYTGFPVDIAPSRTERDEPHISLSFSGFDKQGTDREKILFNMTLSASGEGPSYFLDEVIELSGSVYELRQNSTDTASQKRAYLDVEVAQDFKPRATFNQVSAGRFQENQEGKFKYSYIEIYRVELSYNPIKLEETE